MDFDTRQKVAIAEINEIMNKYGVGLQAFINVQPQGILPQVRLVDTTPAQAAQAASTEEIKTEETNVKTKTQKVKKPRAKKVK